MRNEPSVASFAVAVAIAVAASVILGTVCFLLPWSENHNEHPQPQTTNTYTLP